VALIVDAAVPAADVEAALRAGAATAGDGALLEDVRLFDVYTGEQVGEGKRSLAFRLAFGSPERTLTDEDVAPLRASIVDALANRFGAVLRA
jgi:phenylalanyl-tRNA synthetase beta chain